MVVRTEFTKKRGDIKLRFILGNKTINEKIKNEKSAGRKRTDE